MKQGMACATSVLLGLVVVALPEAHSRPKLARTLPSEVKTLHFSPNRSSLKPRRAAFPRKSDSTRSQMELLAAFGEIHPLGSRYLSRTVFFWRSAARLPASFLCDDETLALKLQEAETQAMEKCQANEERTCRLQGSKVLKQGKLNCSDIPGADCSQKNYYAGCVAVALVFGSKDQMASD